MKFSRRERDKIELTTRSQGGSADRLVLLGWPREVDGMAKVCFDKGYALCEESSTFSERKLYPY